MDASAAAAADFSDDDDAGGGGGGGGDPQDALMAAIKGGVKLKSKDEQTVGALPVALCRSLPSL